MDTLRVTSACSGAFLKKIAEEGKVEPQPQLLSSGSTPGPVSTTVDSSSVVLLTRRDESKLVDAMYTKKVHHPFCLHCALFACTLPRRRNGGIKTTAQDKDPTHTGLSTTWN